jgi:hypothetical protein
LKVEISYDRLLESKKEVPMWQIFLTQSTEAAKLAFLMVGNMLSRLIGLLIIIVVGWLISKAVKALVLKILQALKLDSVAESTGINDFLAKGGLKQSLSGVVGSLVYGVCLLVVAAVSVDFLGLNVIGGLLNNVILYIPNVILSIFILVLGIFLSTIVGAMVQTAAANTGLLRAKLLAKIVEVIILVFTIVVALEQLKISTELITLVIKATVVSIAGAIAIAFGLGCKEMAAKALSGWLDKIQEKR